MFRHDAMGFLLLLLGALVPPGALADDSLSVGCNRTLASFALTRQEALPFDAPESALFQRYKNDPVFAAWLNVYASGDLVPLEGPGAAQKAFAAFEKAIADGRLPKPIRAKTVLFTNPKELDEHSPLLCTICRWERNIPVTPTEYYQRVLSLRKGDTVVFEGRTFVLGEFLGRGNTAHVFAIDGDPEHALRIPFYVAPAIPGMTGADEPYSLDVKFIRRFQREFVALMERVPDSIVAARVKDSAPDGAWVRTRRVNGTENGRDFYDRTRAGTGNPAEALTLIALRTTVKNALDAANAKFPHRPEYDSSNEASVRNAARQFVLEGQTWVLVDPN